MHPALRPRPLARVAAVAALLALASCGSTGQRVSVLGDSITSFDQPQLEQSIGADHDLAISGNFGYTVAEVLPAARVVAARRDEQVIINLGTNDVQGGVPLDRSMAAMAEMVALFPAARCIHLVDVNEHMVDTRTGRPTGAAARRFNEALRALARRTPRVSVIDWNAAAAGALDDHDPPTSTLTKDSVHPTAAGNDRLNELYAEALDRC